MNHIGTCNGTIWETGCCKASTVRMRLECGCSHRLLSNTIA